MFRKEDWHYFAKKWSISLTFLSLSLGTYMHSNAQLLLWGKALHFSTCY